MRIAVFTSNQPRHVALIERLASVAEQVVAVQECNTVFPGRVADFFRKSAVMQRYFEHVIAAERTVFGGPRFPNPARKCGVFADPNPARECGVVRSTAWGKTRPTTCVVGSDSAKVPLPDSRGSAGHISTLPIRMGDLNLLDLDTLAPALDADLIVVFGASFIRGPLCDVLVRKQAVNIHMGISPQYRGSSCNFWALYDRRPDLVGATIHRLSHGLDSGPILFHALPVAEACDGFLLGMKAVQAAQDALIAAIRSGELWSMPPVAQDRTRELRYTRNADFTDAVAEEYLNRLPDTTEIALALQTRDPTGFLQYALSV